MLSAGWQSDFPPRQRLTSVPSQLPGWLRPQGCREPVSRPLSLLTAAPPREALQKEQFLRLTAWGSAIWKGPRGSNSKPKEGRWTHTNRRWHLSLPESWPRRDIKPCPPGSRRPLPPPPAPLPKPSLPWSRVGLLECQGSQRVTESHTTGGSQACVSQPASKHHLARWLVKKQISECHPKPRNLHFKQAPIRDFPGGPVVKVLSSSAGW